MHYYQFNIGDYNSHTLHLDPMEDLIYRRLLDWVYLHESPLPSNVEQIAKYIRLRDEYERITNVLQEFFELSEYGYTQKKAMDEIAKFKDKSEKAKAAINKRWAASRENSNTDVLQTKNECNSNHKPITNNHKPINNNINIVELDNQKAKKFNFKKALLDLDVDEAVIEDWIAVRAKKKAANTQTVINSLIRESKKANITIGEAVRICAERSWQGFKADWLKTNITNNQIYSKVTSQNIVNLEGWEHE